MKPFRILAIALIAMILAGFTLVAEGFGRFDLLLNPISGYILEHNSGKAWGTPVSMVPKPFLPKSLRLDIEQRLKTAGFQQLGDKASPEFSDEIIKGHKIYSREASTLVCNIQLYVILTFDKNDTLIYAEGTSGEHGCL